LCSYTLRLILINPFLVQIPNTRRRRKVQVSGALEESYRRYRAANLRKKKLRRRAKEAYMFHKYGRLPKGRNNKTFFYPDSTLEQDSRSETRRDQTDTSRQATTQSEQAIEEQSTLDVGNEVEGQGKTDHVPTSSTQPTSLVSNNKEDISPAQRLLESCNYINLEDPDRLVAHPLEGVYDNKHPPDANSSDVDYQQFLLNYSVEERSKIFEERRSEEMSDDGLSANGGYHSRDQYRPYYDYLRYCEDNNLSSQFPPSHSPESSSPRYHRSSERSSRWENSRRSSCRSRSPLRRSSSRSRRSPSTFSRSRRSSSRYSSDEVSRRYRRNSYNPEDLRHHSSNNINSYHYRSGDDSYQRGGSRSTSRKRSPSSNSRRRSPSIKQEVKVEDKKRKRRRRCRPKKKKNKTPGQLKTDEVETIPEVSLVDSTSSLSAKVEGSGLGVLAEACLLPENSKTKNKPVKIASISEQDSCMLPVVLRENNWYFQCPHCPKVSNQVLVSKFSSHPCFRRTRVNNRATAKTKVKKAVNSGTQVKAKRQEVPSKEGNDFSYFSTTDPNIHENMWVKLLFPVQMHIDSTLRNIIQELNNSLIELFKESSICQTEYKERWAKVIDDITSSTNSKTFNVPSFVKSLAMMLKDILKIVANSRKDKSPEGQVKLDVVKDDVDFMSKWLKDFIPYSSFVFLPKAAVRRHVAGESIKIDSKKVIEKEIASRFDLRTRQHSVFDSSENESDRDQRKSVVDNEEAGATKE